MNAATEIDQRFHPVLAGAATAGRPMRAIVHTRYGTPDVLAFGEVERPAPGDDEVLVQVHAAGASIGDHHLVTGKPYVIRLSPMCGLTRPKSQVPGSALAGRVVAVGAKVTTFRPGDEVFGESQTGAFAEYVVAAAAQLAAKPRNLSFEEAAATPWGVTPLQGLRDAGRLQPGQKVLINGASGGVGTWAVQIAKAMGAHVTAVCSTRNVERLRALGADQVIDYTQEDFVDGGARFDLMFDTIGNRSVADCRKVLLPAGAYVSCSGGNSSWRWLFRLAKVALTSLVTGQRMAMFVVKPNGQDLRALKDIVEAGKVRPAIERRYPLREVAEALRQVGAGHAQGQTVIRIAAD